MRRRKVKVDIRIMTEAELRENVSLNPEIISEIEKAFLELSSGRASMPPILRLEIPDYNGELDVKTAYIKGLDNFALKASSGFFDNRELGLPSLSGFMVVMNSRTGMTEALLLDNGYLTDVRTGAAGAVAAKHLSGEELSTVGIIGTGSQGRFQLRGLDLVRDFDRVIVYDLDEESLDEYLEEMSEELNVKFVKSKGPEGVVTNSQLIVTTTPASEPYLRAEWLHPGLHITSMGSDAENKQELFPEVMLDADKIFCDRRSQVTRLGEANHAVEKGYLKEDDNKLIELGDVISGDLDGRTRNDDITVCDLTGVGIQDTAVANFAYELAKNKNVGLTVKN